VAIAIRPRTDRSFERSSPVARYWLAQCEGFRVAGRVKGTVERVVGTSETQDAEALVVRRAWRRHKISITDVDSVVPAARLITIGARRAGTKPHKGRRLLASAKSRAVRFAGLLAHNASVVARYVADLALAASLAVAAMLFTFAVLSSRLAIHGAHRLTAVVTQLTAAIRVRRQLVRSNRLRTRTPPGRGRGTQEAGKLSRAALLGFGPRRPTDRR
jgi:hypothetical protein